MGASESSPAKVDKRKLMEEGKLILFVDLDETLVHSTEHKTLRESERQRKACSQNAWCFKALIRDKMSSKFSYFTSEIRPGVHEFLREMSLLYKMYVTTTSHKSYASEIVKILDPEGKLFEPHIFAREYFTDHKAKDQAFKDLFDARENLPIVAIDDRPQSWDDRSHLIRVKEFHGSELKDNQQDKNYLEGLTELLTQIHVEWFKAEKDGQADILDIKSKLMKSVLKGINIHCIAKNTDKMNQLAKACGASLHKSVVTKDEAARKGIQQTTHILTTAHPREDIEQLARQNNIHLLKVTWLNDSSLWWQKLKESHYVWEEKVKRK